MHGRNGRCNVFKSIPLVYCTHVLFGGINARQHNLTHRCSIHIPLLTAVAALFDFLALASCFLTCSRLAIFCISSFSRATMLTMWVNYSLLVVCSLSITVCTEMCADLKKAPLQMIWVCSAVYTRLFSFDSCKRTCAHRRSSAAKRRQRCRNQNKYILLEISISIEIRRKIFFVRTIFIFF